MAETIDLRRYPLLRFLAWNRVEPTIAPDEALWLYESARGQIDLQSMDVDERALVERLVREVGEGVFLD